MSILERINSSNDIKKLQSEEIPPLCREIRDLIVETVSRTGGHLASNLGAVELTVALHRVYDSSRDRVVFDVGHQSYAHKILTGRRERFSTLRQYGGLSGFPKPWEAEDDAFIAGHASNSVSVALGMARARTLQKENYDVVAVIGDGALTGGLAYEGLANAAASGEPMVILLNDNHMSIDPNVGGTASILQGMRVRPSYISFKRWYRSNFSKLPALYDFNHQVKEWAKEKLLPGNMFSAMGLEYIGPVDGHDPALLETVIRWAKEMGKPVIVHVVTKKGMGCRYAEEHPERYHGVSAFDELTGKLPEPGPSFSEMFGKYLCEFAGQDPRIAAVTAAMAGGTGLDQFAQRYPNRFFDVGIAEGHATSMVSGMAKQGVRPVFAVYSSFLQRGFDMMIHDVSLLQLPVLFGVDRAGLVGSDGETHHGIFDISYLRTVPGMTIYCPASFAELHDMMAEALSKTSGPAAIRYPRGGEGEYRACSNGSDALVRDGTALTIVAYGTMINDALKVTDALCGQGISTALVKINRIGTDDYPALLASLKKTGAMLCMEEVCAAGCVGELLLSRLVGAGLTLRGVRLLNLGDGIVAHGDREHLLRDHGLDTESVCLAAKELL